MPRFYGRLFGIKINEGKYTKALDKDLQILVRKAAREWLKTVITRVPVWTGMAKGSIKFASGPGGNLAAYLNVSVPIDPVEHRKGKTPEIGGRFGRYNFTSSRHIYRFTFRSDVIHYIHNEFFARTDNANEQIVAPWQSLIFAELAYRSELRRGIATLPKVAKYIEKVEIPFGK